MLSVVTVLDMSYRQYHRQQLFHIFLLSKFLVRWRCGLYHSDDESFEVKRILGGEP